LERCIRSALDQDYTRFEHIVYDNCSSDETLDILRRYPHVNWVSEPDAGQSDALNKAIRKSRGEIIAWINADDFYEPGTFALAARELARDTGVMAVVGRVHLVDDQGRVKRTTTPRMAGRDYLLEFWDEGYGICQPGVLFRREVVERVGEFRTDLHYAMDYDFWLRMVRRCPVKIVDQVLARYVIHPASKSGSAHFGRGFNEELERVSRQYWGPPWRPRYWRLARGCERFLARQFANAIIKTHQRDNRVDWVSLGKLLWRCPLGLFQRHLLAVFLERAIGVSRWNAIKRRLGIGRAGAPRYQPGERRHVVARMSGIRSVATPEGAGHPAIQIQVNSPLDAPGGGAAHAAGLARALRRNGIRVSLLCTGRSPAGGDGQLGPVVARRPANLPLLWRWPPWGTLPSWVGTIRKHSAGVDAIVALSAEMAVASRLARPGLSIVYCPAALNGCEQAAPRLTSFQRCERRAFRGASAVLYPAKATRSAAELLYGPLPGRSAVCPLGVERDRPGVSTRARRERGIPPDAFVLLTVGTINENKGQLAIARTLAKAAPDDWWWVLIGDGPDRPAVEAALRGASLAARTVFVGNTPHAADWYAAADVLVSASRCETFSLACAEALAAGLPVVLPTNRPGSTLSPLAEFVTAHQLGCTFEREQPETLARALADIAAHADERARMGVRARELARTHFSWDLYADCVLELAGVCRCVGSVTNVASRVHDS
jgi:glycosyltransferase involved in cell wall biosynthesis